MNNFRLTTKDEIIPDSTICHGNKMQQEQTYELSYFIRYKTSNL